MACLPELLTLQCLKVNSNDRSDIHPEWTNLTALTSICLKAKIRDYECIDPLPNLCILDLHFIGARWWDKHPYLEDGTRLRLMMCPC